jgi:hypothetical protein
MTEERMRRLPFKDGDYVPREWNFDTTKSAFVLKQQDLRRLRDELNKDYLRRWSGYCKGVHLSTNYMDYTSGGGNFTDSRGKHIQRLEPYTPNENTGDDGSFKYADGNVKESYWKTQTNTPKDFRGCPAWYGPMDRYVDNVQGIVYSLANKNVAPYVNSNYSGPDVGESFPIGTSDWYKTSQYHPHGDPHTHKDRSIKHLIDGLCNIVDIDKYYGTGIQQGDPVVPYNKVNYRYVERGVLQNPYDSERINHSWRQTGVVNDSRPGTIKDWIAIITRERRNTYYVRACNYKHWIWWMDTFRYYSGWDADIGGNVNVEEAQDGSFEVPSANANPSVSYDPTGNAIGDLRVNHNPSYYGHREAYTSCLQACTGFCSQSCFHVCDEQCVYMCDDVCGYTCMDVTGRPAACGNTCISNCRENCGGYMQEGGSGGDNCQNSCSGGRGSSRYVPGDCGGCDADCGGYVKDEQACSDCVGYCSNSCEDLCIDSCRCTCQGGGCTISCSEECNIEAGEDYEGKAGCAVGTCEEDCFDTAAPEGEEGEGEGDEEGDEGGDDD